LAAFAGEYRSAATSSTLAAFLDGALIMVLGHHLPSYFLYGRTSAGPAGPAVAGGWKEDTVNYAARCSERRCIAAPKKAANLRDTIGAVIVLLTWRGALFLRGITSIFSANPRVMAARRGLVELFCRSLPARPCSCTAPF
jgi:hypothetical protein